MVLTFGVWGVGYRVEGLEYGSMGPHQENKKKKLGSLHTHSIPYDTVQTQLRAPCWDQRKPAI